MPKDTIELLPLEAYDRVVVASSGGKDSLACLLYLLERGVPAERLELWHHLIDGAPGSPALMDWPVTGSYVRALAAAFGLALRQSWREGGFEREMTRSETPTGPVRFELDDGTLGQAGGRGPAGTRRKFPQVSADLKVRWCSAYLKVDVGRAVFSNVARYARGRFLFVTGERREESPARSRYAAVQPHESSTRARRVDHWRAVAGLARVGGVGRDPALARAAAPRLLPGLRTGELRRVHLRPARPVGKRAGAPARAV